jgi:cytochrome c553
MVTLYLLSCSADSTSPSKKAFETPNYEGQRIVQNNCVACHSPGGDADNRAAPPLFAVKKHYLMDDQDREEFIAQITAFLLNPSKETAKMPGAVKKFGVMPPLGYTEAQLKDVAEYLFDTDMEEPDWFQEHFEEEHGAQTNTLSNPHEAGLEYAMNTKSILGKNLMKALNKGGAAYAVDFCTTRAIPLTDSMSTAQEVKIRRVSDRPRNPMNSADSSQVAYMDKIRTAMTAGEPMEPWVIEQNDVLISHHPIMTNDMCMQCHGEPDEQIAPEVMQKLAGYYPDDEAKGYQPNELRGLWVVEMKK